MATLNNTDLTVRLMRLGCKFSCLANDLANDLKFGRKCARINKENLALLNAYIEILEEYIIGEDNCLTEENIQDILNNTSKITKLCFQPIGKIYLNDGIAATISSDCDNQLINTII